jgi:hypothetical protein
MLRSRIPQACCGKIQFPVEQEKKPANMGFAGAIPTVESVTNGDQAAFCEILHFRQVPENTSRKSSKRPILSKKVSLIASFFIAL